MKLLLLTLMLTICFGYHSSGQWQQLGGPEGGSVTCFAQNGSNIFAGTVYGGVFLSTNNGNSWTAVNNGLSGLGLDIYSIAINGNNIFLGTRQGAYLSTNNGISWTAINNGLTN